MLRNLGPTVQTQMNYQSRFSFIGEKSRYGIVFWWKSKTAFRFAKLLEYISQLWKKVQKELFLKWVLSNTL